MTHQTRPRTCSNPAPVLKVILFAIGAWLVLFGAWGVLKAVALAILGGAV